MYSIAYYGYYTIQVLCLFCHVLVGNLEPVVFRYHLLMADFIDLLPWNSNESFNAWSRTVYPFLEEEGLEQLSIEYTGYSRNQPSKVTVLDYLLWLILKQREPLLLHVSICCVHYIVQVHVFGSLVYFIVCVYKCKMMTIIMG